MSNVIFSYVPDYHKPNERLTFTTQFNPNDVSWEYAVNTNVIDTYGGQVVQVLSINIDNITIEGQFGYEGARGYTTNGRQRTHRPNDSIGEFDPSKGVPGLIAMTEFFRGYFAVSSQGGDTNIPGAYLQIPMSVSYDGDGWRHWPAIFPYDFPSYVRSNENFAPTWRIVAHVSEADSTIQQVQMQAAIDRLQLAIGYTQHNPFSDPNTGITQRQITINKLIGNFKEMLPNFTQGDLENMLWNGISIPNVDIGPTSSTLTNSSEFLPDEVLDSDVNTPLGNGLNSSGLLDILDGMSNDLTVSNLINSGRIS